MAESNGLLNRRTGQTVPRVRIPPSPPFFYKQLIIILLQIFSIVLFAEDDGCKIPCRTLYAEKALLSFEDGEIPPDGLLWKGLKDKISDGRATEGKSSWCASIKDEYGFLGQKSTEGFYERWRYGGIFRTLGWYDKVFPADWSGWQLLRVDFCTDGPAIHSRMEIEDIFLPFPVVSEFEVPGDTWVTLEVDLDAAVRERRIDITHIAHLLLMVWSVPEGRRDFKCYMDNMRLAQRGAPVSLPLVKGGAFLESYSFKMAGHRELPPFDISKTSPPDGEAHVAVEFPKGEGGGYPLIYVNERCVGGFGNGGMLLSADRFARLSLNSGGTWTGLDGKPGGTVMSEDHRGQHRSEAMIEGNSICMAYCSAGCGGGGTRVTAKFTKAVYMDGRWTIGPESIIDQTSRYCHDRFALCHDTNGRLWCSWSHLNNMHKKDIRAKWSMDAGETWLESGENARIGDSGVFHYPGTPGNYEGPYLSRYGDGIAAFWHREPDGDIVWTHSLSLRPKIEKIVDGKVFISHIASDGIKQNCNMLLEKEGKVLARLPQSKKTKNNFCL